MKYYHSSTIFYGSKLQTLHNAIFVDQNCKPFIIQFCWQKLQTFQWHTITQAPHTLKKPIELWWQLQKQLFILILLFYCSLLHITQCGVELWWILTWEPTTRWVSRCGATTWNQWTTLCILNLKPKHFTLLTWLKLWLFYKFWE